jgi:hypothetical protein
MDETKLLELFARMRKRAAAVPVPPYEHPGMLTFARARSLVLNPSLWTEEERRHVSECRRCARLVARCEQVMYHPPWWLLERKLQGQLNGDEAKTLSYHLDQGQCQRCLNRVRVLEAVSQRIVRQQHVSLRDLQPGVNPPLTSDDGVLVVEVIPHLDKVFLEVSSREPTLSHQLIGYAFQGATGRDTTSGFLVLRPDENGLQTADVSFSMEELVSRTRGECRNLVVCPVEPSLLTEGDREALLTSLERDQGIPDERRVSWEAWLDQAMSQHNGMLPGDARQLLDAVRARLAL